MPAANTMPTFWVSLRKSIINWISESLYGVRGVVTSATTGLPLAAKVTVMSHDADSSQMYTDPAVGDYHRMIAPGTWTFKFESTGYLPQTISGVSVTNLNMTLLNVQMQPQSPYPVISYVSNNAPASIPAGGSASLNITVQNDGGSNATNMQGTLVTSDENVTVTQNTSLFPTIAAFGGTGVSISQYGFNVSPTCPDNHVVSFLLILAADGNYNDTITFEMILARPIENFETGNFASYPWQFPGILPWTIVTSAPYEGTYCAQSGAITPLPVHQDVGGIDRSY